MAELDHDALGRFAGLVSAYGARPEAWPAAERAWASSLMRTSPEARRLVAEAAEVDGWLDSLTAPPAPPELKARILAGAPAFARAGRRGAAPWADLAEALKGLWGRLAANPLFRPVARPFYAVAAAALAGLLLGWGGVFSQTVTAGEEEEIVAMAFVGGGLERYDLGEWQ